jgi:hypothetical protein
MILEIVYATLGAMTALHGLEMAKRRGKAQLPYWSRMAIQEFRHQGMSREDIAVAFRCSFGTVANVLQGKGVSFKPISGERNLTHCQQRPPGRSRCPPRFASKVKAGL